MKKKKNLTLDFSPENSSRLQNQIRRMGSSTCARVVKELVKRNEDAKLEVFISHCRFRPREYVNFGTSTLLPPKLEDESFLEILSEIDNGPFYLDLQSRPIFFKGGDHYHKYIASCLAKPAFQSGSDIVELGTWHGSTFYMLLSLFPDSTSSVYLVDTYKGIPEEQLSVNERETNVWGDPEKDSLFLGKNGRIYDTNSIADDVRRRFSKYNNVHIIEGMVPEVLTDIPADNIGFAHIDMNNAYAELAGYHWIYPKMQKGGIILYDDFLWEGHHEQRDVLSAAAALDGEEIIGLPTGQGFLMKRGQ